MAIGAVGAGGGHWAQAKWTWTTALATTMMLTMAMGMMQLKRRRQLVGMLEQQNQAGQLFQPGAASSSRRDPSSLSTASRRPAVQKQQVATDTQAQSQDADAFVLPTGLHVRQGLIDFLFLPFATEVVSFLGGLLVIYLTQIGRVYSAVGVLALLFIFRLKSFMFTASSFPITENTRLQLLKSLDRDTLHEILREDLPRWVKFPDVEKCEWINYVLDTLWPYVKIAVARSVRDALTPVLESIKPKLLMTDLGFSGFDLGTSAPVINGIKTLKNLEEQVVLEVDILFATRNTDIVFTFGNPKSSMSMTIELSDVLLRGTLRIMLKPLFPRWPTFGAISVSFIEKPAINFHVKVLHVNLMEVPALSSTVRSAIRSAVEAKLVWPNKLVIPLVQDLSKIEMEALAANKPLGMIAVKNLRLSGVSPVHFMSRLTGLYGFNVRMSVGNEIVATDTIESKGAHDFGAQSFYLLVLDPKTQDLNLALDYKETLRNSKAIDSKWIHLDHLEPRVETQELMAFGRDGVGRAEFDLTWYPFSNLSMTQRRMSRDATLPMEIASMGAIFVKLVNCENLASMDYNGSSDPYVIFHVGSQTKKSSIKNHNLNPIWNPPEHFEMIVPNHRHDQLVVIVMDADYLTADDEIGRVEIPLAQVQRNTRMASTWRLNNDSGSITLELEWKSF